RPVGQEPGASGRQRHRRLRPVAAGRPPEPDQGDRADGEDHRRALQSGRGECGGADRGAAGDGAG
ncbi:hypothetical protein LTR94_038817, partial [Friedmanniomyces endolithicus]